MIPIDRYPPAPEGFRERFIDPTPRGGWRGCERAYGARREVMQRWIAECGGPVQLASARRRAMEELKAGKMTLGKGKVGIRAQRASQGKLGG